MLQSTKHKKLIIILILIVVLPLLLLGWQGWKINQDNKQLNSARFDSLVSARLNQVDTVIQSYFEEMQIKWGLQIQQWNLSNNEIRKRIDDNGNIRQIFVIDAQNKRQFPPRNAAVTQSEQTFVDRLELIWRDPQMLITNQSNQIEFGETLEQQAEQQIAANSKKNSRSISPSASSYSSSPSSMVSSDAIAQLDKQKNIQIEEQIEEQVAVQVEIAPVAKTAPSKPSKISKSRAAAPKNNNKANRQGWYMWHWGSDSNLIFWQQKDNGTIVGVEMEPVRVKADLISRLPDTVPGDESSDFRLRLLDTAGQVVYQWGNYQLGDQVSTLKNNPQQKRPLSYPLSSWALEYYGEPFNQSGLSRYTLLLTFLGFAFLISALAWFLYREQTREMRLAEQRVQFVSQVSHELKTPLTNIRMYAELLEEQIEDEEKPKRYVQVITDESKRLSRLISNVLNFSREPRIHKRKIYPDDVVTQSIEHFAPSLEAKQIVLEIALTADQEITSDPDILEQVLNNLLSNVEKYAASGKRLDIKSEIKDDQYRLSVRDYGDGISKSERKHIFIPFYRINDKLTEGVSGTGIGLTIARQQAQHLGGSLEYIEVNQGACFELRIPTK